MPLVTPHPQSVPWFLPILWGEGGLGSSGIAPVLPGGSRRRSPTLRSSGHMPDGTCPSEFAVKLGASTGGTLIAIIRAVFQTDEIGSNVSVLDAFPHGLGALICQQPAPFAMPQCAEPRAITWGNHIVTAFGMQTPGRRQALPTLEPHGKWRKGSCRRQKARKAKRAGPGKSNCQNRSPARRERRIASA